MATATIEDLYKIHGKAELVWGKIIRMSPIGVLHGYASGRIFRSLDDYAEQNGGIAFGDNVGFEAHLSHRVSFSPDAAYYTGSYRGTKFAPQAPIFAVEIRSPEDYGVSAEGNLSEKRADYFASGTLVVWDVDLTRASEVRVYRNDSPHVPTVYKRGQIAEAEPAVPGWTMAVNDLFPDWYDDAREEEFGTEA